MPTAAVGTACLGKGSFSMSTAEKERDLQPLGRKKAWRSSLYDEPLWVSIAWIVVPVALGALAMFLTTR